jgi:hypothetical protein
LESILARSALALTMTPDFERSLASYSSAKFTANLELVFGVVNFFDLIV